ncbi:acyl-CoA dehydrogenase family protein [Nocardioides sp.]|uniref:acyl-CoA dehydrogenase family protein n=1 Tax=Nocardioides sp. TaxID=35761 RepID=UPI0035161007
MSADVRPGRSEEQHELALTLRQVLTKHAGSDAVRAVMGAEPGYDTALWTLLCEQIGVAALAVPEEHDGAGFTLAESVVALEELGRALAPSPLLSSVLTAEAILATGDADAAARLLPRLAAGEVGAVVLDDGAPVLDAIDATVLVALTDAGLVDVDPGSVTRRHLETVDQTLRLAAVDLEAAITTPIGDAAAVDAVRDRVRLVGALGVTALQIGLADRALSMTVEYSRARVQFGRPIGSFQALKHRMAEMLVLQEMGRSAVWAATEAVVAAREDAAELVHVAKAYCSEAAERIAAETVQMHGGIAITWEHDAHLVFKRAHALGQLFGAAHHHRAALTL